MSRILILVGPELDADDEEDEEAIGLEVEWDAEAPVDVSPRW